MPRDLTQCYAVEDFATGPNTPASNGGTLNWQCSGATTQAAPAGHPGILRLTTAASNGATAYAATTATASPVLPAESFDMLWIFKVTTADGTNGQRIGASTSASGVPTDGIYLEKLEGDASWFAVTRAANVQTRSAALGAVDTGWHKLRIRRVNGTTVGFTLDAGAEVTQAATVPTAAVCPWASVFNAAASALQRSMDLDYFDLAITGLVR